MVGMLGFSKPANHLDGKDLDDGWRVIGKVTRGTDATGGNFSTPYIVEKNGQRAFMKAMDLSKALLQGDLLEGLKQYAESIEFEGAILGVCKGAKMNRVVQLLHHGKMELDSTNPDPLHRRVSTVYYFIFELADSDLRKGLAVKQPASQKLNILFNVALAIQQLHAEQIAHQDIKPSNVVSFDTDQKVADLGRASKQGLHSPNDKWDFPGDTTYQPPEFSYKYRAVEFLDRRQGADVYALGSLLAFLFTMESATPLLMDSLPDHVKPGKWKGGGFAEVLPHLVNAHARVAQYLAPSFPESVRSELTAVFQQLTHPDPVLRGHPSARNQVGRPLGVDRYVSIFDRLRRKCLIAERLAGAAQ